MSSSLQKNPVTARNGIFYMLHGLSYTDPTSSLEPILSTVMTMKTMTDYEAEDVKRKGKPKIVKEVHNKEMRSHQLMRMISLTNLVPAASGVWNRRSSILLYACECFNMSRREVSQLCRAWRCVYWKVFKISTDEATG